MEYLLKISKKVIHIHVRLSKESRRKFQTFGVNKVSRKFSKTHLVYWKKEIIYGSLVKYGGKMYVALIHTVLFKDLEEFIQNN